MLAVSPVDLSVSSLPVATAGWSCLLSGVTSPVHASGLDTGGGESAEFSVGVLSRDDPVDAWVSTDGLVRWVDHDDFVELEGGVLSHPVRVENAQVGALASNTLLSNRLVSSLLLELADTLVAGLSVNATLLHVALASTSADTDSVDDVALLGLVSKSASLLWARWSHALVDSWKLTVLPGSDSEHKAHEVRLLLSPELFEVFVGTHCI